MNTRITSVTFLIIPLVIACALVGENAEKPSRVFDYAGLMEVRERDSLSQNLMAFEEAYGSQIVVMTIDSLGGETIETYANRIANTWGVGRAEYDDGILVLISHHDRQVRIEVGYGLELIIKDEIAARIIREDFVPSFREGEYFVGLHRGVTSIQNLIRDHQDLVGKR